MPDLSQPPTVRVAALVVAAGRGERAGQPLPKQYTMLGGQSVLRRTVAALAAHPRIDVVQVVIGADDGTSYRASTAALAKLLPPVIGGATRQQSVRCGLEALSAIAPKLVLVHDAARPFVAPAVIDAVIDAVDDAHGAMPALAVTDTIKRAAAGLSVETVARDNLHFVQTPQGFPFGPLLAAHRSAASARRDDLTDDEAVAALAGLPVRIVEGDAANFKLTRPADFAAAERMLSAAMETRTAQGFDVHAFGPGQSLWLCGVEILHPRGLLGHSDADVGLHALTDALLGAIGDGDIGQHFPPSDPAWKDARSDQFLADAARRVREHGGRIVHLDITLICEEPKIGPHRERMRQVIARITQIALGRVSVKATTSEELGFTGRREGIAALAMASVELPRGP